MASNSIKLCLSHKLHRSQVSWGERKWNEIKFEKINDDCQFGLRRKVYSYDVPYRTHTHILVVDCHATIPLMISFIKVKDAPLIIVLLTFFLPLPELHLVCFMADLPLLSYTHRKHSMRSILRNYIFSTQ